MTSRTNSQYTPGQIIDRCTCITLDDFLSRGENSHNPMLKRLANIINSATAYNCGAHLLEWPNGSLVLVTSQHAREFSQLSAGAIIAAYGYVQRGCGLIYRDHGGSDVI